MNPFQSFGALVFGPDIKNVSDVPRRLRSNDLIEFCLYVSVTMSTLDDFGRRSYTISATP